MSFEDIKEKFLESSERSEDEIPTSEADFFGFICLEYLRLETAPYYQLIHIHKEAFDHMEKTKTNISDCMHERKRLEQEKENLRKDKKVISEEILYSTYMLDHYIKMNEDAQKGIIEFVFSKSIYECAYLKAQKSLFKGKCRPWYAFGRDPDAFDRRLFSDISNKFLTLDIKEHKRIEDLYKKDDKSEFNQFMHSYIENNRIPEKILSLINQNHYLNKRSYILKPALDQYTGGNKAIFLHVSPLQIEGIFHDYCNALEIPEHEISRSSISEKIDRILKINNGFYSFEYFKFSFPIIRNKVAHGKIMSEKDVNSFSDFILLDLLDVSERFVLGEYPLNKVLTCIQDAYNFRDSISLIAVAFALAQKIDIPDFYQVQDKLVELKIHWQEDYFFDNLKKLIKDNNKIINKGIVTIVNYLEREGIAKEKCKSILRRSDEIETSRKKVDLMSFVDELDRNFFLLDP
ncbi:MAG: hypothetical protein Fur0046_23100 [Cyanobacteria bacterium J069]